MNYLETNNKIEFIDISLDELAITEGLSKRSKDILFKADLISLILILEHYKLNRNFLQFKHCDITTNKEIRILCKKYIKSYNEFKKNTLRKTKIIKIEEDQLEYIAGFEGLSVRSRNVLINANLNSLELVLDYYNDNYNFLKFTNCGFLANDEIIVFCKKHTSLLYLTMKELFPQTDSDISYTNNDFIKSKSYFEKFNSFNSIQLHLINTYYDQLFLNLDPKDQKILNKIFNIFTLRNFFKTNFKITSNLKQIEYKTLLELSDFKLNIQSQIEFIDSLENKQLLKKYFKHLIGIKNLNLITDIDELIEPIFNTDEKIKLFTFFEFIFTYNSLFEDRERMFLLNSYSNSLTDKQTLDSIALKIGLTRERARQIKVKFESRITYYIIDIIKYIHLDIKYYDLEIKPVNIISNTVFENINDSEGVSFNEKFYTSVFKILLNTLDPNFNSYDIIKFNFETKNKLKVQEIYLVKKELSDIYNFEKLFEFIVSTIKQNAKTTFALNLKNIIQEYFKLSEINILNEIEQICIEFIHYKYNLTTNKDGNIRIERNKAIMNY